MVIRRHKKPVTQEQADSVADALADKPYGNPAVSDGDKVVRTSISLPSSLLDAAEDFALANKRTGVEPKSTSAVIRVALQKYIYNK